ncbi:MAG: P-loop NTPase [Bacilli bacterium]
MSEKAVNKFSKIRRIYGIVSGKGGVGKSFVTSNIAVELNKMGFSVGILDADITGPSIPHMFGIKEGVYGDEEKIFPAVSKTGIKIISSALLLSDGEDPIMWRGPLIGDLVTQFYTTVNWGELDYLLIDFPPGTSDVALSSFQQIPIDGIILVTTTQQMVSTMVQKTNKMAEQLSVDVLGVVINMSHFEIPDSDDHYHMFGEVDYDQIQNVFHLKVLGAIPFVPKNAKLADEGKIELVHHEIIEMIAKELY